MGAELNNTINPTSTNLTASTDQPARSRRESSGAGKPAPQVGAPAEAQSDRAIISDEALRKSGLLKDPSAQEQDPNTQAEADPRVAELKRRDREVRAHEQAHVAAGGSLVRGGAAYKYAAGPDGHTYATGGEVSIDVSPIPNDPAATIRKMARVARAALAPAQPSGQDRVVAVAAAKAERAAREELARQQTEKLQEPETPAAGAVEEQSKTPAAPAAEEQTRTPAPPAAAKEYVNVPSQLSSPKETTFQAKIVNLQA
jgi:hypothetical protein